MKLTVSVNRSAINTSVDHMIQVTEAFLGVTTCWHSEETCHMGQRSQESRGSQGAGGSLLLTLFAAAPPSKHSQADPEPVTAPSSNKGDFATHQVSSVKKGNPCSWLNCTL